MAWENTTGRLVRQRRVIHHGNRYSCGPSQCSETHGSCSTCCSWENSGWSRPFARLIQTRDGTWKLCMQVRSMCPDPNYTAPSSVFLQLGHSHLQMIHMKRHCRKLVITDSERKRKRKKYVIGMAGTCVVQQQLTFEKCNIETFVRKAPFKVNCKTFCKQQECPR